MSASSQVNHSAFALVTIAGCYLAHIVAAAYTLNQPLTLGLGYVSLCLIVFTLVIGPVLLLRRRRNPVNINLRRDAGIWAGITGALHVFYSLQGFALSHLWSYFLEQTSNGSYALRLNLFGLSNDVGLAGALILLVLTALSNNIALLRLKGKLWKKIQRLNYLLIVLVVAHAIGYQVYTGKGAAFNYFAILLAITVLLLQLLGIRLYLRRKERFKPVASVKAYDE